MPLHSSPWGNNPLLNKPLHVCLYEYHSVAEARLMQNTLVPLKYLLVKWPFLSQSPSKNVRCSARTLETYERKLLWRAWITLNYMVHSSICGRPSLKQSFIFHQLPRLFLFSSTSICLSFLPPLPPLPFLWLLPKPWSQQWAPPHLLRPPPTSSHHTFVLWMT